MPRLLHRIPWAATNEHNVAIWIIEMAPHAQWILPAANSMVNRSLYFFQGDGLKVADREISSYKGMELDHKQDACALQNGPSTSRLLLLQGKPINEPTIQHGPLSEINRHFRPCRIIRKRNLVDGHGPLMNMSIRGSEVDLLFMLIERKK